MDRVALDLGFIKIYWYSITMFLGVLFGIIVAYIEVKRKKTLSEEIHTEKKIIKIPKEEMENKKIDNSFTSKTFFFKYI